jgi:glucose-6-phosphate isomerase
LKKTELDLSLAQAAWSKLKGRFDSKEVGFFDAPVAGELNQLSACANLAEKIRANPRFTDCLFLGIGGSSLGPISLLSALKYKSDGRIRFHFQENPDPTDWKMTLSELKPENTLVVCVTKSGTTFETLAQFLLALDWLTEPRWQTHVVAITDPAKGDLNQFAKLKRIETLFIDPSIGGRFSLFSPVGLFPALLSGLDAKQILKGAEEIRDYCLKTPIEKNPLWTIAASLLSEFETRPIHVGMPYSTPLRIIADWWVQLWAESLGKDGKGFTPIAALGATDQHSILQLLRDGPDDKITWFFGVDQISDPVNIPARTAGLETHSLPAFARLQGHSLQSLLKIEQQAISLVLTKKNKPHWTWTLDKLDERSLGSLTFALCILTAITGTLGEVNPFDQPGVEEGKIYIRDALTRARQERA